MTGILNIEVGEVTAFTDSSEESSTEAYTTNGVQVLNKLLSENTLPLNYYLITTCQLLQLLKLHYLRTTCEYAVK